MSETLTTEEHMGFAMEILRNPGEVTELRILGLNGGNYSGYFDDPDLLVQAATRYNGSANVYVTLNPVNPALLARAGNRMVKAKQTTSDVDILHRHWLPIDLDPVRPSGISSTEEEHEAALALARQIRDDLVAAGWPKPVLASSGNGAHLLSYIDLPNDNRGRDLVKAVLDVLDLRYSDEQVKVDTSTYNAARIWKLYGTVAMKGEDTEDRPHRVAWVLEWPEEGIDWVPQEMLEATAALLPPITVPAKRKGKKEDSEPFDLESWLASHRLQVAYKSRWQNKGTRYILETCPWNHNHENRSAFVIEFDGGGYAAGCLHDSCRQENWQSLRKLLEPDRTEPVQTDEEENQAEKLVRLGSEASFFTNEIEEAYAAVEVEGHTELWKLKGKQFKLWLTKQYYEETGKPPGMDAMRQAIGVMEMKAMWEGEQRKLQLRVAELDDAVYYDLTDKDWRVVKVTAGGCEILTDPPILFVRTKNMKAQVEPDFDGDVRLLLNHVRLTNEDDQLLFLVYVVSCFLPSFPHPVMVLCGEKGAAKSTAMRMTRAIVDPAVRDLFIMPNSVQDLALCLAKNWMPCFDNMDRLSPEKSDLLCTASTGGGITKRTLFTDDDETILEFKRCVALNGINVVATRADLLDRSIIEELDRIDEEERKEERAVWAAFEADRPKIVGGALVALATAMGLYNTVELDRLGRMADFTRWGYAIAEAIGYEGERFLNAYFNNQMRSNDEVISSHPVAAAIVALLKKAPSWRGSVANLLSTLDAVARREGINTVVKTWPHAPHILSRRLNEIRSNLKQVGVSFDIRPLGDNKIIHLEKDDDVLRLRQTSTGEGANLVDEMFDSEE